MDPDEQPDPTVSDEGPPAAGTPDAPVEDTPAVSSDAAPRDEAEGAAPIADHDPDDHDAIGDFTEPDIDLSHLEVEDDEDGRDPDDDTPPAPETTETLEPEDADE